MMVISRRLGEGIVINGNIRITVVKVGKGRIRLGLIAPPSVRIHRREELAPDFENPDGVEALGGSSLAEAATLLAFPLNEFKDEFCAGKVAGRKVHTFPALVELDHGTGNSHRGCR